ncbi:MAG: MFS transporter [Anaerolineaceae bacterium]
MGFNNTRQGKTIAKVYYFAAYGAAFMILGLASAALGPMLPYLAKQVNVSLSQISFVFTAVSLGYLLGSAGGGQLLDRFKGHPMMLVSVLISIIALFFIPLTSHMSLLLVILFILGIGQGVLDVGGNTNLLWVYQARVGPYMNALHFCFGAGAFLSPIILHYVMRWSGGQLIWPYWSLAFLTIPTIFGFALLPSPTNLEKEENEKNSTHTTNSGLIIGMIVLFFVYVGIENGFGGWIFTYVSETKIATETAASLINSIFWGAITLGRLLAVPLTRKIKAAHLLLGNFFLAIFFLTLIIIFPSGNLAIWVGSAGLGLALSSVFPTLLVLGESRLRITGRITGLFFLGSSLGSMLIPMLLGQIFEQFGSLHIITTLLILTFLGFGILLFVIFTSNNTKEKLRSQENLR